MSTYFENDKLNYAPYIKATLHDPLKRKSVTLELMIDTGFQGGVLIPLNTYVELGLNLFEEPKIVGKTALGDKVELRVSKVFFEYNNIRVLCNAYTALGVKKALLGREVLRKTGLLYKPPHELKIGV